MTVKELIKKLERVKDKDIEVVIQGIDPTDYIYYNEIEMLGVEKVYLSEDDTKKTKVYIIDGGMF
jgi:transcription antitermination factor NusA-like protein